MSEKTEAERRAERLAAQLRANLKKRKEQQRARRAQAEETTAKHQNEGVQE